jgi:hypothetical protein
MDGRPEGAVEPDGSLCGSAFVLLCRRIVYIGQAQGRLDKPVEAHAVHYESCDLSHRPRRAAPRLLSLSISHAQGFDASSHLHVVKSRPSSGFTSRRSSLGQEAGSTILTIRRWTTRRPLPAGSVEGSKRATRRLLSLRKWMDALWHS